MSFFFICVTVLLPFESENIKNEVADAIIICQSVLIPSLFPYLFFSKFVSLYAFDLISLIASFIFCPLFNISPSASSAVALGILGGFPTGALLSAELYKNKKIERKEAERLPLFSNNAGPMFVISACGLTVFHSIKVGATLYLIHIFTSLIMGILTRPYKKVYSLNKSVANTLSAFSPPSFLSSFSASVTSSVKTMGIISGTFIIFKLISFFIGKFFTNKNALAFAKGIIEITGGILSLDDSALIIASFLIGFNSLSIHMQSVTAFSQAGLSYKYAFVGKIFSGFLSALLTTIVLGRPYAVFILLFFLIVSLFIKNVLLSKA